ncbi:MAG: N-acetylmuramoyl-L-alanine amidase [Gracilibacteraceae bacterium]|jgi:N-acetylmuramoyl-L-alanine amidase|nr:N-acetylmuramoyl-L-alanine amidase [Gracilibacteraceae bacterium]
MKKRRTYLLLWAGALLLLWAAFSPGGAATASFQTAVYENPHTIIVAVPGEKATTTGDHISLYGACDYDYPLYLNGTAIPYTEHGFFAQYLALQMGENRFTLENNGVNKTVLVIREAKTPATPDPTGYTPQGGHGVVRLDNITHRQGPGTSYALLEPLVRGVACVITGRSGAYYRLADGSYIFQSAVNYSSAALPSNRVLAFKTTPLTEDRATEIRLKMPVAAYYNVEMQAEQAVLTLYNTGFAWPPELKENAMIRDIVLLSEPGAAHTRYAFRFQAGVRPAAYYVACRDGGLVIGFRHPPAPAESGDLSGMKILLDAGHGGSESGALGAALTASPPEKDINLAVTLSAEEYLRGRGATVIMTRTDDTFVSLVERVALIKQVNPDISVSIHNNSVANTTDQTITKGLLVCYSLPAQMADARFFADALSAALERPQSGTGLYLSNLALTRLTNCPAVLIEAAFLSNPEDYEWLLQAANQQLLGTEIGRVIEKRLLNQ